MMVVRLNEVHFHQESLRELKLGPWLFIIMTEDFIWIETVQRWWECQTLWFIIYFGVS